MTQAESATKAEVVREAGRKSLGVEVARMTEAEIHVKVAEAREYVIPRMVRAADRMRLSGSVGLAERMILNESP